MYLSDVHILGSRIFHCFNSDFLAQSVRLFVCPSVSRTDSVNYAQVWKVTYKWEKGGGREGRINTICDHAVTPLTLSSFNKYAFTLLSSFHLFTYQIIHSFIHLIIRSFICPYRGDVKVLVISYVKIYAGLTRFKLWGKYSLFFEFSAHWVEPTNIWDKRKKIYLFNNFHLFKYLFFHFIYLYGLVNSNNE